jgi:type I restriction enzyme R subunit
MSAQARREEEFEREIAQLLTSFGGYTPSSPTDFSLEYGVDPVQLFAFLSETQPSEWAQIVTRYGGDEGKARENFLDRLSKKLSSEGTIAVLRNGIKDQGVSIRLCYFRPATTMNQTLEAGYAANRVTVTRQWRYSSRHNNTVDLALLVNGLVVASAELKNRLTDQTVEDAKAQYRTDRDPEADPFLKRPLVHFAVDQYLVAMTTTLKGNDTDFLPFNQGNHGGQGNPPVEDGYETEYLWRDVWAREPWLDILGKFVQGDAKSGVIFPRFHQWDAVTQLVADAKEHGAGRNYLIQHSAGSGKSKSISWLAHQLSTLHNSADRKVFDKIIVVTDRRVLDEQLREDVQEFERVQGVVQAVEGKRGAKSTELADALTSTASRIVVCTVQTFPFVLDLVRGDDLKAKKWAVIIDEAHSSQTGDAAAALRQAVGSGASLPDGFDEESPLAELLAARGHQDNMSFFAFTATPKDKTVDIFGTLDSDGVKRPFHVYSMRQAIEEGFILNVLANYATYRTYYRFGTAEGSDARDVDRSKAGAALRKMLVQHPEVITQKARIIVEHFRVHTAPQLGGLAKAMVVTDSRASAVKYKRAIDEYIKEMGYDLKALVAFSGKVLDDVAGEVTESSLNDFPESQTADRFKGVDPYAPGDYQVMVVAEKFQTGFDEPLLHTMFVDKTLTGLAVVQTLSRLNRSMPGKDSTFVLDFRNDPDAIKRAFQRYYEATTVEPTDANALTDAYDRVMAFGVCVEDEVRSVIDTKFINTNVDLATVYAAFRPALNRFNDLDAEQQAEFRETLTSYVNLYAFISQVLTWTDADGERLHLYGKALLKLLPPIPDGRLDIGSDVILTQLRIDDRQLATIELEAGEAPPATPLPGGGGGRQHQAALDRLGNIVDDLNARFGLDLDERDQLELDKLFIYWMKSDDLRKVALANDLGGFRLEFERAFRDAINANEERIKDLYGLLYGDEAFRQSVFDLYLERVYRYMRGDV